MKKITITPFMPTEVKVEKVSQNRATIIAYPFETGYAVTLAHPLRRLLMSSSVGYAPIAVKVEGASHEFDSVRGMIEDIALFIINLKNIRFKIKDGAEQRVSVNYSFSGNKEIKGKDLVNDVVDVVTPEQTLANINSDITLNFTVIIQKGIGYVPSEDLGEEFGEGFIKLDAFFTPVRKAVYSIENMLVEDNPNFERIVFDITTDGQIDPLMAFKNALDVTYKQLSVFDKLSLIDTTSLPATPAAGGSDVPEILLSAISELALSARSFNALEKSELKFVGELVLMGAEEVNNIKNLGKKSFDEIIAKLEEIGFGFNQAPSETLKIALQNKLEKLKA